MKKFTPIGKRTLKTAIAVILSALTMEYIIKDTPFFACIGAVASVERTMKKSIEAAFIRNLATAIGGVVGIVFSISTSNTTLLGLGIIPVICVLNLFKKHESIVPGCIVFFAVVYLNDADTGWIYGIRRISETFIGSMIGLIINNIIKNPIEEIEVKGEIKSA